MPETFALALALKLMAMLHLLKPGAGQLCDRISRRQVLEVGGLSLLGLSLPRLLSVEAKGEGRRGKGEQGRVGLESPTPNIHPLCGYSSPSPQNGRREDYQAHLATHPSPSGWERGWG